MVGKFAIVNAFNELFDTSIQEMTLTDICISGDAEIGLTKGIISTISGKAYYFTIMCWFASNDERAKIKRLTSWQSDGPNSWGQFPSHTHF